MRHGRTPHAHGVDRDRIVSLKVSRDQPYCRIEGAAIMCGVLLSGPGDLDGMRRAFLAAWQDGSSLVVVSILGLAALAWLVHWILGESRRKRVERQTLEVRREAVIAEVSSNVQRRQWVRVPSALHMTLWHRQTTAGNEREDCTTRNVSAGGVAFLSRSPPAPGVSVRFTLDLGEKKPLSLEGVVVRVEPSQEGAPSLVALKFEPCPPAARERIVRWVAHEEKRELALARQGQPCAICGRPVADEKEKVHATCAEERDKNDDGAEAQGL